MAFFVLSNSFQQPGKILLLKWLVAQGSGRFTTLKIVEFFQTLLMNELVYKLTASAAKARFLLVGFKGGAAVNTVGVHGALLSVWDIQINQKRGRLRSKHPLQPLNKKG